MNEFDNENKINNPSDENKENSVNIPENQNNNQASTEQSSNKVETAPNGNYSEYTYREPNNNPANYERVNQTQNWNNNPYQHGGYQYPQGNPSYNGYQNPNVQNSYSPRNGYMNSYAPYSAQRNGEGQIQYSPAQEKAKNNKNKKYASKGFVAVLCCLAVILSGLSGFGGALIANSFSSDGSGQGGGSLLNPDGVSGDNVVIYRSMDEVQTSLGENAGDTFSYAQIASIVKDSVVEITTEYNKQSMWFQYVTEGAGSGVIISTDGYIVTNSHVISDEENGAIADSIKVRLTNGEEHLAEVVGHDAISDIAILKIEAEDLTAAVCGNSDNLAVGEELIVVGNPLGSLGGTITNGIVSATERTIQVNSVEMTLIQTNAAVNPGNSGGGMFNMRGELIGIVNAKSSGTGIEGLGFAIPINEAIDISKQLLEYGYVRGRADIGVTFIDVNSSQFLYYHNLKSGVYVNALEEGYNDDVLRVGDRIIAVNDTEISYESDIRAIVSSSEVGDELNFKLYRNGKLMEVVVVCYESVPDNMKDRVQFEDVLNGFGN